MWGGARARVGGLGGVEEVNSLGNKGCFSHFTAGKRAMRKKVSKAEMQDWPWRNGSLATLMGGM